MARMPGADGAGVTPNWKRDLAAVTHRSTGARTVKYAGFTSTQTLHGGQESTLLNLYTTFHHFGGLIVSPGYTDGSTFVDGNPYGVSHVTGGGNDIPVDEVADTALDHLVTRAITISRRLSP